MDCSNGNLLRMIDQQAEKYQEQHGRPVARLTPGQVEKLLPLGAERRKNYMRNQPCVCGSNKKFKKCCWGDYA